MKGDLMKKDHVVLTPEQENEELEGYRERMNTPFVQIKEPGEMDKMIESYVGGMVHRRNPQMFEMLLKMSKNHKDFLSYCAGFLGMSPRMAMEIEAEHGR